MESKALVVSQKLFRKVKKPFEFPNTGKIFIYFFPQASKLKSLSQKNKDQHNP